MIILGSSGWEQNKRPFSNTCVGGCSCVCAQVHMLVCAHTCRSQRMITSDDVPQEHPPTHTPPYFETRFLFACTPQLGESQAFPCLTFLVLRLKCTPFCSVIIFMWVLGYQTQVFELTWKESILPTEHLPSLSNVAARIFF